MQGHWGGARCACWGMPCPSASAPRTPARPERDGAAGEGGWEGEDGWKGLGGTSAGWSRPGTAGRSSACAGTRWWVCPATPPAAAAPAPGASLRARPSRSARQGRRLAPRVRPSSTDHRLHALDARFQKGTDAVICTPPLTRVILCNPTTRGSTPFLAIAKPWCRSLANIWSAPNSRIADASSNGPVAC